jgi:peptidoglycan/xylan/chitin deacetylase (PgdA/CDA1 family)
LLIGLPSTFYIISGFLGEQFPQYMDLDEIKELEKQGHEIGCHTASHRNLTTESPSIIESEINLSLKYLKDQGLNIKTFCYPYGEYNEEIVRIVKQSFSGARSCHSGYNERINPYLLECYLLRRNTTFLQVKKLIDNNTNWLILVFHQINNESREWSSTPEMLKQIVDYIIKKKIEVITNYAYYTGLSDK